MKFTVEISTKDELLCWLEDLCNWLRQREKPRPVLFSYKVGLAQQKGSNMLELSITTEEQITVTLKPVTPKGQPVTLDGKPDWSVVSGDSTLNVAADGLSATLVSADTPGDTDFLVEADADLGEGKETVSDIVRLTVGHARARSLGLSAGAPELKP